MSTKVKDDQLDESYIKADGTRPFSDDQSMGGNKLKNLGVPEDDNDAVRKIDLISGPQIIVSGSATLNMPARTFTLADWEWKIFGPSFTPSDFTTAAIPTEADGTSRVYHILGSSVGTFIINAGDAYTDLPVDPSPIPGTIYLTRFVASGSDIGEPEVPIIGSDYYKKIYLAEQRITEEVLEYPLPTDGRTNFVFVVGGFEMEGFTIPSGHEHLFPGKLFFFYNLSDDPIALLHQFGSAPILFTFPDELDFVLAPKAKAMFQYSPVYGLQLVSGGGPAFEPSDYDLSEFNNVDGFQTEAEVDAKIEAATVGLWDDRGSYNASSNTFPSSGGSGAAGAILKGDIWTISVAGTLGGVAVHVGDTVRALIDSPASSTDWALLENNIGYVSENSANKATDLTAPDHTKYPTTLAVQNQLDAINFNINNVLENEILQNGLVWMVPFINGGYGTAAASSQYLRTATAPAIQNNPTPSFFGMSIATFETTAVAGVLAFIRSHQNTNISVYSNIITVRDFRVDANISSDCRFWIGFSQNYTFGAPTNTDPSVHTECIYVAKLSTSNNLHIVHNDNAGAATTIDLGANFPANNDTYKFRMYLIKESASSYYLTVYRTTIATGVVLASSTYHLTANLPTNSAGLIQICTITNNATATNMRLGDYGLIIKNLPL